MAKSSGHTFNERELNILSTLYNGGSNRKFSSDTIHESLNQKPQGPASPETIRAIESLIALKLLSGKRSNVVGGKLYFSELKLTAKGEQGAIRQKHAREDAEKAKKEFDESAAKRDKEIKGKDQAF